MNESSHTFALLNLLGSARTTLAFWLTSPTTIFSKASTPARQIHELSLFVILITGMIFLVVSGLLVYALFKFRSRPGDAMEPPQVFGSTQIELAWTIIPILILVVLFLGTARVIFAIEDAPKPKNAVNVVVVGHQFWWEFRYPDYNVVTANELHVPASDDAAPIPTYMKLTSADVIHSFWVPRLAGKTDLLPNRVNEMWMDPHKPGIYEGQCAQFCGPQHAKMLLRVVVDTPADFQAWITAQQQAQQSKTTADQPTPVQPNVGNAGVSGGAPANVSATRGEVAENLDASSNEVNPQQGRRVFEEQACINCHAVRGTVANGRYGPDLTHLMSRATIAAGAANNTPDSLKAWITDPAVFKAGSLMPAMHLTDRQNAQITSYLTTLQ